MLVIVSMLCYSRSHHLCKFQQLMSMYFRASGLSTKCFDTLNSYGLCMNQRWVYSAVDTVAEAAHTSLHRDITTYPWFGSHDNLNRKTKKTFEQRLENQGGFESGTAGTIYVIKDPTCPRLDPSTVRAQFVRGSKERLTYKDILKKESNVAPLIFARSVHRVLSILVDSPAFDLGTYAYSDSSVFDAPPPVQQLPTGPVHATCAYMLNTVQIEEASYEGNIRVLEEWERQLKFDTPEKRKKLALHVVLIWIGDQLTVSRLHGIQQFRCEDLNSYERLSHVVTQYGWFHLEVSVHGNFHSQYYGSTSGRGLAFAAELLNRTGLRTPTVQGLFHHNMEELLVHFGTARLRDVWCKIAGVDSLAVLRDKAPAELYDLAVRIVQEYASTKAMRMQQNKETDQQDGILLQSI